MNTARRLSLVASAAGFATAAPAFAQAASGPDYSTLTNAVSFTSTQTAILSVGALAVGLALVVVGIRKILRMIKGA